MFFYKNPNYAPQKKRRKTKKNKACSIDLKKCIGAGFRFDGNIISPHYVCLLNFKNEIYPS